MPEGQVRRLVRDLWMGYGIGLANEFVPAIVELIDADRVGVHRGVIEAAIDRLVDRRITERWAST